MSGSFTLGQRIKQMREAKGLSQSELAGKAMIAQSTLSYIEAGKKSPTFETLRAISEGLNASVMDILKFNDDDVSGKSVESYDKSMRKSLTEEEIKQLVEFSTLIYKKFGKGK